MGQMSDVSTMLHQIQIILVDANTTQIDCHWVLTKRKAHTKIKIFLIVTCLKGIAKEYTKYLRRRIYDKLDIFNFYILGFLFVWFEVAYIKTNIL